jgi:zinc protease
MNHLLKIVLSISIICGLQLGVYAEARPSSPLQIEVIKETLPNGLTLIMNPDHRVPTVAVELRYLVGSGHERVGRSGFAHLFEHLMFQGSKNYDQEYFTPFTPIGGKVNGTTNTDRTNYFEQVPAEALELALWMESDRMEGLLDVLSQEKLDNQRDVVKNERRQRYENTPYGMVWKIFANELYPMAHPYQHTTIGSHKDLTAATLDDVKSFFKTYYVPANTVLTLVGDFKPTEARKLVNQYFGHLPSGERAARPNVIPIPENETRTVTYVDRVKLPRVYLAWHTPALYEEGDAEMDLLASLLTGGKSSALYQPLVFEKQIAKEVFAFQVSRALGSYFVIAATAAPGQDIDHLTETLQAEVHTALSQPPTNQAFTRASNEWRKSFYTRVESVMDRAHQLSTYEHLLGKANAFSFDLERYTKVTPQSVTAAGQHWIQTKKPLIVRVVPQEQQPKIDRTSPPVLAKSKPWQPPKVDEFTLENGLQVWLVEQSQSPLISMQLILNQGANSDPSDRSGLTWLTANLLDEGAGARNALEVSDALRLLATDYGAGVYQDFVTLSMDLLGENLSTSLDLYADFLLRPRFEEADFKRVKKQRIASAIANRANPKGIRNLVMMRTLFNDGYAGLPSNGLPKTLANISLPEVKTAYKRLVKPQGSTLIVVGHVSMAQLKTELNRVFSDWKGVSDSQSRPLSPQKRKGAIHWIDFPGSTQSAVAMVRRVSGQATPSKKLQDELFNLVFGGKFTSRLNLNLREDKGYTYGAYSGLYRYKQSGMHFLGGMIKGDQTTAAIKEMISEIDGISSVRPIQLDELNKVRGGELKGYPAQFEERSSVLGLLSETRREGYQPDWLNLWMTKLNEVTLEQTQNSAIQIGKSSEYSIIIAGDKTKHLDSIKELKRPIFFYTPDGDLVSSLPSQPAEKE